MRPTTMRGYIQTASQNAGALLHDQVVSDLRELAGGWRIATVRSSVFEQALLGIITTCTKSRSMPFGAGFGGDKDDYDIVKHSPDTASHYQWVDGGLQAANNYNAALPKCGKM